jgi:hypothetical protein
MSYQSGNQGNIDLNLSASQAKGASYSADALIVAKHLTIFTKKFPRI